MNESQKETVKRQGLLRRMILYLLKDTNGIRLVILSIGAYILAVMMVNFGPAIKNITTTHPLYLPKNVQLVENFNEATLPQIDFPLDRYWEIVKNYDTNSMSLESEKHGQRIAVNYYLKDRNSGIIIHATNLIYSPGDDGTYCYAPVSWNIKNGQLTVERHYQVYNRPEEIKYFLMALVLFMILVFSINGMLSLCFREIIKKMELSLAQQIQA